MLKYFILMSSAAHRFGRVEFWMFVLIFSTAPGLIKQQQLFNIQNWTRPKEWATKDISIKIVEITPDYPWNILPLKNYFQPVQRYFLECKNLLRNTFLPECYQKYSIRSCRGSQNLKSVTFLLVSHAPRNKA